MINNILIPNKERFEKIKNNIKKDGINSLCIFTDFDRTLTYGMVNGKRTPSMIAGLRNNNDYLGEDYVKRASLLAEKYRPIEFDPTINENEKKESMQEWWKEHLELLIEKKLNKNHLERIVEERSVKFRDGLKEIFYLLKENNIPLVIISASGLGVDPILMMIEKEIGNFSNIHIISNSFSYDKDGNVTGYKVPVIDTMNKDNVSLQEKYFYSEIKDRKNIMLLGDSFDDVKMAENVDYKNLIKIGFLSDYTINSIEDYKKLYDVLFLNDSSMEYVKSFLQDLCDI